MSRPARDVKELSPGYGVMVATFRYVPGTSTFPQSQVAADAASAAGRLLKVGYQSFTVRQGPDCVRVGLRVSTHSLAIALRRQIDQAGRIDLGGGERLRVPETEIVNLAELKTPCPVR